MSFLHFIKILFRNLLWLIIIPLVLASTIYYFTRNEKKVYSSETVIYTGIASGYNLSGNNKADFFATSNAFDNLLSIINSRETRQLVAIHLLATHLLEKQYDPSLLSWGSYDDLQKLIPDSIKQKLVKPTLDQTILEIGNYMQASDTNLIYRLLNSDNPFYSVKSLQEIKANRINSSDLIKVSYETNDAAICKHTLEILVETFIGKHKLLREGQTDSVIAYFEKQTRNSYQKLDSVEQLFLDFNKKNDIINYYEQTKAVAGEKENLYAQGHNLEMDRQANGSALNKVNENISGRVYQALYGPEITSEREKLSDIFNKIALSEVMNKKNNAEGQKKYADSLRMIATGIEKNLKATLEKLYAQTNTPNGIPTKTVLDEWLKTTLAYEESKARLTVMDKRKAEFQEEYKKFAPLGATLKKIERQISVSEQEYLELLHGLSQAKLTQQNNELTSKLTIVDPPYLPLKANASKRTVLIAVGFIVGFILVLGFILANTLINKTLQEPSRASKLIGVPVLGIYPMLKVSAAFLSRANTRLTQKLLAQISNHDKPVVIGITSTQKKEGKSTISSVWEKELKELGYTVQTDSWKKGYRFSQTEGILLLELPALEDLVVTKGMIPELTHVFLICRANRVWSIMDKESLAIFTSVSGIKPIPILNGVDTNFAEDYIGEAPKSRTGLRSLIKRIVKFEFGNRRKIS